MAIETILLGTSTTLLGASLSALYSKYSNKEKIVAHVTSIEFSSSLLSRVDHIELPEYVAAKYRDFEPWISMHELNLPDNSNILTIGAAQETKNYIAAFLPVLDEALNIVNDLESNGCNADLVRKFFKNNRLSGVFWGMCVRQEMPTISLPASLPPCVVEYEEGEVNSDDGTISGVFINTQTSLNFQKYRNQLEKNSLLPPIQALCHAVPDISIVIVTAVKQFINSAKVLASELDRWLEKNIDKNSTILMTLAINNLGKSPVIFDNYCTLRIHGMDGDTVDIPCISEDFNNDTATDESASRIIQSYSRISKSLGVPLKIRNKVPLDQIMVPNESQTSLTYRSAVPVKEMRRPDNIISYYQTNERRAEVHAAYTDKVGKQKAIKINRAFFGSNLDLAEKAANKKLQGTR